MIQLRDTVRELIDYQTEDYSDEMIREQQRKLNTQYERFTAQYGLINSRANSHAFSDDSSYFLLCSLEVVDEEGRLLRKADMFTKRTIRQRTHIKQVDTASEALAVSIGMKARVDLPYMAELTGLTQRTDQPAAEAWEVERTEPERPLPLPPTQEERKAEPSSPSVPTSGFVTRTLYSRLSPGTISST